MKRLALSFLMLMSLANCGGKAAPPGAPSDNLYTEKQEMMGTFVAITVVTDEANRPKAQDAVNKAFAYFRHLEDLVSFHRDDTEVARINREAFDHPVPVSDETYDLIKIAVECSRETEGAFDITVGPLVTLWAKAGEANKLPTDEEIKDALGKVGAVDKIKLDDEKKTVQFAVKGMSIDLGGIAKGYAVDKAIAILRAGGIENAIVQAGGQVHAIGRNPDGRKWRVGVRNFFRKEGSFETIELEDMDVATSGDYERFVIINGRAYSHIIDPRTGRPVEGASSVSIIAKDGTTADGWSTAASVLGVQKAMELFQKNPKYKDCQLLFAGCTPGFRDFLAPEEGDK
jgi:thiamine biosynthesis lipoprotein